MKQFNLYPLVLLLFISGFAFQSCKDDTTDVQPMDNNPTDTTDTTTVIDTIRYSSAIKAILDNNCAVSGCHNSGSAVGSLATYNDAVQFVSFGRILGAIKRESGYSPMPKNAPKLADSTIQKIEDWIGFGTPE